MKKFFQPDSLPWDSGNYIIKISDDVYKKIPHCESSYNVLYCRLLGLSYADGFRFIRDNFNGKIHQKNGIYCNITFEKEADCRGFCDLLSERWSKLIK